MWTWNFCLLFCVCSSKYWTSCNLFVLLMVRCLIDVDSYYIYRSIIAVFLHDHNLKWFTVRRCNKLVINACCPFHVQFLHPVENQLPSVLSYLKKNWKLWCFIFDNRHDSHCCRDLLSSCRRVGSCHQCMSSVNHTALLVFSLVHSVISSIHLVCLLSDLPLMYK